MTSAQAKALYWPAWARVASVHGWKTARGRLIGQRRPAFGGPVVDGLYQRIWNTAQALAENAVRAPLPDDFRHACHIIALGQDVSSLRLSNAQLDRVVALLRLLADPDDVEAMMLWSSPEDSDRRRIIWRIRRAAPLAYIDSICRDRFGPRYTPPNWEELPIACLRDLVRTLSSRTERFAEPIPPAVVAVDCPF